MTDLSAQEKFKRGAADAGRFFNYIAKFVGFSEEDAAVIRENRFIIEKHIPSIVADFYTQLLRFPATRRLFLRKDGTVDREYLELRMYHQTNFWRRAASGKYDEDFARFIDYVGRSHTSQGADPNIYIPERYVIGMVGFMQQRVTDVLHTELHAIDHHLALRAAEAWSSFLMVILEMLSRAYARDVQEEHFDPGGHIDEQAVQRLAVDTYERALGIARTIEVKDVRVAGIGEIPEGKRKIVEVDGISIGVFNHDGVWVALHNSCLHRGGPVCQGKLEGDTLTCPWHGYQYDVRDGHLYLDPSAQLTRYPVSVRQDGIYLHIRTLFRDEPEVALDVPAALATKLPDAPIPAENEFEIEALEPGGIIQVRVDAEPVAVFNIDGSFYATHSHCTHQGGPLSQGRLDGHTIICPWHDSCFDVRSGEATCGPANLPVRTYTVVIANGVARVEAKTDSRKPEQN